MSKASSSPAIAAIVAFTGCTAAFLAPQTAFAFQLHGGQASLGRPVASHPAFRPVAQPRPMTSAVQPFNFARPIAPSIRPSLPRPMTIGGTFPRPMNLGGHFPRPGMLGGNFPHPGQIGGNFPRPMNLGGHFPRPGMLGGNFPRPMNLGGHFPHPGQIGGAFPRPGTLGDHVPHFGQIGGRFPTAGSIGGRFPSAIGHVVCNNAPCPTGGLAHRMDKDLRQPLIERNRAPGRLGDPNRFGFGDPGKLRPPMDQKEALTGHKGNGHAGFKMGFGKNPVETAQDVGKLEQQFNEAMQAQGQKKKALTATQGAESAAAGALGNATLTLQQAIASGNPVAIANAQIGVAQAQASASAANAAVAKAATDFDAAKKTTADIRKDLTLNKKVLNDQIKIEQLQNQLRRAQTDIPVGPGPFGPVGPGPFVGPVGPIGPAFVGPVGPAPFVGPAPEAVGPAPVIGPAPVAVTPQVAAFPAQTAPMSLPAPGSLGTRAAGPAPIAAQTAPEFVSVAFKQDVSATDLAAFLRAYKLSVVEGPSADGVYKLRLDEPLPTDQLPQLVDSIKSQTNIVANAIVS